MIRLLVLFVFVSPLFLVQRSAVGQSPQYVNDDTPPVGWYWARHEELKNALKILKNFDRLCTRASDGEYLAKDFDPLIAEVIRNSENAYTKFKDLEGFKTAFHGCYENNGPDSGAYVIKACADERIQHWIQIFENDRQEAKRRAQEPLDANGDPIASSSQSGNTAPAPAAPAHPRSH